MRCAVERLISHLEQRAFSRHDGESLREALAAENAAASAALANPMSAFVTGRRVNVSGADAIVSLKENFVFFGITGESARVASTHARSAALTLARTRPTSDHWGLSS